MTSFRSMAVTGIVLCCCTLDNTSSEDRLTNIANDWRARRDAIANITCLVKGTVTVTRGSWTWIVEADFPDQIVPDVPSEDYSYNYRAKYVLDFSEGRVRLETSTQLLLWDPRTEQFSGYEFRPVDEVRVFDGQKHQTYRSRQKNNGKPLLSGTHFIDLFQKTEFSLQQFFLTRDFPVALSFSLLPHRQIRPDKMTLPLSLGANIHVRGSGSIEGREHIILRTASLTPDGQTYFEYWVDTSRGSVISRVRSMSEGHETIRIETEHEQQNEIWFPSHSRVERLNDDGELAELYELDLAYSNLNSDLHGVVFHYSEQPGMVVQDSEQMALYSIDENGVRSKITQPQPRAHVRRVFFVVIVVGCVVLAGFLVLMWVRRK